MAAIDYAMDYSDEPTHSNLLLVQGTQPFNAEPKASALVEFHITPEELFYCRNHGPVKEFEEDEHFISVNGGVEREVKFSVTELRAKFPEVQIVAALQVVSQLAFLHGVSRNTPLAVCR